MPPENYQSQSVNLVKLWGTKLTQRNPLHSDKMPRNKPKEVKGLYSENCKIPMKEIKGHKQMKRYTMFLDWQNQHCENDYTTQSNLQTQHNPYETTNGIFHKTGTKNFSQFVYKHKRP